MRREKVFDIESENVKNVINEILGKKDDRRETIYGLLVSAESTAASVSAVVIKGENGKQTTLFVNRPFDFWHTNHLVGNKVKLTYIPPTDDKTAGKLVFAGIASFEEDLKQFVERGGDKYADLLGSPGILSGRLAESIIRQKTEHSEYSEETRTTPSEGMAATIEEIRLKFVALYKCYPPTHRTEIERLIAKYDNNRDFDSTERTNDIKQLKFYVNFVAMPRKAFLSADLKTVIEDLDRRFPGQVRLKDSLLRQFTMFQRNPSRLAPRFCIEEKNGMDIMTMIEEFCRLCGLRLTTYNLAGLRDDINITGSSTLYSNGNAGSFADTLIKAGGGALLILGADKTESKNSIDALSSILRGRYKNEFLSAEVDVTSIPIFVLTKDSGVLSAMEQSEVHIITAQSYSNDEMREHVRLQTEKALEFYGFTNEEFVVSKEVIDDIAMVYSRENDILDLKNIVFEIIGGSSKGDIPAVVTRENIKEYYPILNSKDYYRDSFITDAPEMEKKYRLCSSEMDPDIKSRVSELLSLYVSSDKKGKKLIESKLVIGNLLNTACSSVPSDLSEKVKSDVFGMDDVIEEIEDELYAHMQNPAHRLAPLIIKGPPGIGKTAVCCSLAKHQGKKFVYNNLNTIISPVSITGDHSDPGFWGKVFEKKPNSMNEVQVFWDEFDKPLSPEMYQPFFNMLDQQRVFNDYYGCWFNTDNIQFIMTVNDLQNVPPAILNRCRVISLRSYSRKELVTIAKDYLIPGMQRSLKTERGISDDLLRYIVDRYTSTCSVRELEHSLTSVYNRLNRISLETRCEPMIDRNFIDGCLKRPDGITGNSTTNAAGHAIGLAVYGQTGCVISIDVCEDLALKESVIGLAKGSFLESIMRAKNLASRLIGEDIGSVIVDSSPSGLEKDGPSAGVTALAAILSYKLGIPLGNTAFTGDIGIFGEIKRVGGINEKINTAIKAGIENVYIPRDNYTEVSDLGYLEDTPLTVIPVSSAEELLGHLFPGRGFYLPFDRR